MKGTQGQHEIPYLTCHPRQAMTMQTSQAAQCRGWSQSSTEGAFAVQQQRRLRQLSCPHHQLSHLPPKPQRLQSAQPTHDSLDNSHHLTAGRS